MYMIIRIKPRQQLEEQEPNLFTGNNLNWRSDEWYMYRAMNMLGVNPGRDITKELNNLYEHESLIPDYIYVRGYKVPKKYLEISIKPTSEDLEIIQNGIARLVKLT